jgi:HEAT repeat protein
VPALIDKAEGRSVEAAEALGQIGDARAVGVLVKLLTDHFWNMRRTAAIALGMIGDPGSVPAILVLCGDEDDRVRQQVPVVLGQMGRASIGPLVDALTHRNAKVREVAAEVLLEVDPDVSDLGRRARLAVASGKWSEAGALGPVAVPALMLALRDADPAIRKGAAGGLALTNWQPATSEDRLAWAIARRAWPEAVTIGADAIGPLAEAAIDWYHPDVRIGAIGALKSFGSAAEDAQARAAEEAARRSADRLAVIYRANPRGFMRHEPLAAVREIINIGEALNDLGDMSAMRAAHAAFASRCSDIAGAARNLEIMWHGIGRWQE